MLARCPTCRATTWTPHRAAKGVVVLVKCKRCREQEERQVMSERKETKRPEDNPN